MTLGPLTIVHAINPGEFGGLERVVVSLAAGQLAAGHQVVVAAVVEPGAERDHPVLVALRQAGVPVEPVPIAGRAYLREWGAFGRLFDAWRPHVVHSHGYRSDVIAGSVARCRGIPTVSTVHGFTGGDGKNRLYERIQVWSLRSRGRVVAVARSVAERLAAAGVPRSRLVTVPNAWDPAGEPRSREASRRILGLPPDALVVGWIGRLSIEKGADVLLDALPLLEAPPRRLVVSIIGDGAQRDGLEAHAARLGASERVVFHGQVNAAGRLLRAFDVFVLSSRTEGTPIVLLEAMAAGVPIVASAVGGVPDMISDREAVLVAPERPAALAAGLGRVWSDPEAAAERAARAAERLEQQFDRGAWLAEYDRIYRALVRASPADRMQ
ncbi:MAG: glycosyltransferase [Gemmatimonadota bacterium]